MSRENYNRLIAEWLDRDRQPQMTTPQVDLIVAEVLHVFAEHAHRCARAASAGSECSTAESSAGRTFSVPL